jgi:glycine cleavage system H lipoate-binding protein
MFPWVYGFHWTVYQVVFLGAFFAAAGVIAVTVSKAVVRMRKDFQSDRDDGILWHADFNDLPEAAKLCRHTFTGEAKKRICGNQFDCGSCDYHPTVVRSEGEIGSMPMYDKGILGAQLPQDRLYHRGHTWVRREEDGTYTIGLDDFIHRLIGNPDRIDLPAPGAHLHANGTGWIMKKKRSRLRVLAPIDCVVIAQGSIEKGWLLKVRTDEAPLRLGHLLRGEEIAPWIMHEAERLEKMFEMAHVGCTLADGGELMPDIDKLYPKVDWESVWGNMLLEG